MATEHEARVIAAARAVNETALHFTGDVERKALFDALRALDAGERGAAEIDWPQVEQAIKLAEKDAAAIFAHLRVALTAVNGVLDDQARINRHILDRLDVMEAAAEKEASAGKTTPLRSEVAYLRCVEDAARMVVNAAKYYRVEAIGDDRAAFANLEGAFVDLDEFREEFGYWHG